VLSFTPVSTPLFLVQLGRVLVVLGIASLILDGRASVGAWKNPILLVGRYSLTVSAVTTTAWADEPPAREIHLGRPSRSEACIGCHLRSMLPAVDQPALNSALTCRLRLALVS